METYKEQSDIIESSQQILLTFNKIVFSLYSKIWSDKICKILSSVNCCKLNKEIIFVVYKRYNRADDLI